MRGLPYGRRVGMFRNEYQTMCNGILLVCNKSTFRYAGCNTKFRNAQLIFYIPACLCLPLNYPRDHSPIIALNAPSASFVLSRWYLYVFGWWPQAVISVSVLNVRGKFC